MFSSVALLATVTLALSVAATPVVVRDSIVSLPLAKRFNATSALRLLEHDQRRASGLKALAHAKKARREGRSLDARASVISVPSVNEVVNYAVNVSASSSIARHILTLSTSGASRHATYHLYVSADGRGTLSS